MVAYCLDELADKYGWLDTALFAFVDERNNCRQVAAFVGGKQLFNVLAWCKAERLLNEFSCDGLFFTDKTPELVEQAFAVA